MRNAIDKIIAIGWQIDNINTLLNYCLMLTCKGSLTATVWEGPGTGGGAGVADPWGWRRGKDENGTPDQPSSNTVQLDERS